MKGSAFQRLESGLAILAAAIKRLVFANFANHLTEELTITVPKLPPILPMVTIIWMMVNDLGKAFRCQSPIVMSFRRMPLLLPTL